MPSQNELEKLMNSDLWARTLVSLNKAFQLNTLVIEIDGHLMFPPIYSNSFCPLLGKEHASNSVYCLENCSDAVRDAKSKGDASITRCKSGFARFLIPVRYHGRTLGVVGGCGALIGTEEFPLERINRISHDLGLDVGRLIAEANASIPRLTSGVIDTYFCLLKKRISSRLE